MTVLLIAAGLLVACVGQRPTTGAAVSTTPPVGRAVPITTSTVAGATTAATAPGATTAATAPGATTAATAPGATTAIGATATVARGDAGPDPTAKLPPGGLYDGKRPPQFVLVSFDGAADPVLMQRWRDVAAAAPARLTFFLSAVYLLGKQNRAQYQGPGHPPGASAIGFSPTPAGQDDQAYITSVVRSLQAASAAGNEIGNHYGGHWCGAGGVNGWTKADWAEELNAVENVVLKVDANNGLSPALGPPYDPINVAGSRTPCLEGKLDDLYPVLKARGYKYDASNTKGLFDWPRKKAGLWAFGFAGITIEGLNRPTLTVDFSISTGFNGDAAKGTLTTEQTNQIYKAVTGAYLKTFDTLYYGNRTPLELGNHFNHADGDAYNKAVEDVMKAVCGKPEVVCTTYGQVVQWLDAHADLLGTLQDSKFTKLQRGAAP